MTSYDRRALEESLRDPRAYRRATGDTEPEPVSVLETHISLLFFAGDRVYKVKKPVDLGFLDYTTLEKRRHFCEEEVRLNRRLAGDTYLGVVPIVRSEGDRLCVGGDGEAVEFAVEMIRLPAARMMDRLLQEGEIDNAKMNELAALLEQFHRRAATGDGVDEHGSLAAVRRNVLENYEQTRPWIGAPEEGGFLSPRLHSFLEDRANRFLDEHRSLFEQRPRKGRIRDGHGDLHAGNICFTRQGILIYDCIEFAARLRCGDVACDLGFLIMDLDHQGFRGFASYLAKRYGELAGDEELAQLLPFYKSYRAMVRAKVAGFRWSDEETPAAEREQARRQGMSYAHLAVAYEMGPSLLLTCGLPGTGKSWAAKAVTRPFEAVLARSDVRRKLLAHRPVHEHRHEDWETGIYTHELSDRTYGYLLQEAEKMLRQGRTVVVDATFASAARRRPFRQLAAQLNVPFLLLHVTAREETVRRRMAERAGDQAEVSDADFAIYLRARESFEPPDELAESERLEAPSATESAEDLTSRVLERLLPPE